MRTEHLSLRFQAGSGRERLAFEDVTLDLPEGRITALVGPSGSGKTSFLRCLNRLTDLVPGTRVSGRIRLGDLEVLAPETDPVALRRRVGMIFQRPNPFPLSVRANLELALEEHGVRDPEVRRRTLERALEDVGLFDEVAERLDEPALRLSGGQQQRLCLARALALQPEVVLLDEPTSALDPRGAGVVEDAIAALRGRYTVVVVTHNLAQARRLADRVALLWWLEGAGRLIEVGETAQIFEQPRESLTREYVEGVRG